MDNKTITLAEIQKEFILFNDECGKFNFFTRSKDIQNEKIEECKQYLKKIKEYKKQAIESSNELVSNELFHIQCVINAQLSFFQMWIYLKKEEFYNAWTNLIDANEYISIALKIKDYEGLRIFLRRIKSAEESIFPDFALYISPGFKETIGKCSICFENFTSCEHIENNIYMGKLCQRVDRKILETNHVAFVKKPRDKRCIITKITENDGSEIDYFTWEKTGEINSIDGGMQASAVIFNLPDLDVF